MEILHCLFVFGWIKLKFGVRGNFWLLISNLNSKMQHQFEILRKCHFSFLRSWFLAQHSFMNWLLWQQWLVYLQSFNFETFFIYLPKTGLSLVKISWTVFEIFSQNRRKSAIFSAVSLWWRHKINIMKIFCQFVKISTYSIPLTSFIVFWVEMAKLGGDILPPPPSSPVFLGWQKTQSKYG